MSFDIAGVGYTVRKNSEWDVKAVDELLEASDLGDLSWDQTGVLANPDFSWTEEGVRNLLKTGLVTASNMSALRNQTRFSIEDTDFEFVFAGTVGIYSDAPFDGFTALCAFFDYLSYNDEVRNATPFVGWGIRIK